MVKVFLFDMIYFIIDVLHASSLTYLKQIVLTVNSLPTAYKKGYQKEILKQYNYLEIGAIVMADLITFGKVF